MKKFSSLLFLCLAALAITFILPTFKAKADSISGELIFPENFAELYDLTAPNNVYKDGNEYVFSNENTVAYFDGELYKTYYMPQYSISKSYKVGKFILFLSASKVYSIDTSTDAVNLTDIETATDLDVLDDILITNPSNTLSFYKITDSQETFTVNRLKTYNLGYTPNAITLCDSDALYFENEGNIYYFNNGPTVVLSNILNVRDADYYGGYLYISTSDGIFSLNCSSNQSNRLIVCDKSGALKHLNSPYGIFATQDYLYIADLGLNAITCYNTVNGTFSDFAITKKLSDEHRISETPNDVFCDGSLTYVLDNDYIKVYDKNKNQSSAISLNGYFGAKLIAVCSDTALLSSLSDIKLAKIKDNGLEPIATATDFSKFLNVTAINSLDNDFYILNNEIDKSTQVAVIYKLNATTHTLERIHEIVGRGENMTVDLFGDVYVNVFNGVNYDVHKIDKRKNDQILFTSNADMLSMFCDYDGNVYYLDSQSKIARVATDGEILYYEIEKSQNIEAALKALKMSFSQSDNTCYVLYSNVLLSVSGDSLNASTPKKIAIPQAFSINLDTTPEFVTVEKGSKLIEINLEADPNATCFEYKKLTTQNNDNAFILLYTNSKFAIIANEDTSAIVRSQDITTATPTISQTDENKYFVSHSNVYALPLVQNWAKTARIPMNTKVSVKKIYTYNNRSYALFENENQIGFVATTMLKDGVAGELDANNFTSIKANHDVTYYSDSGLSDSVGTIKSGDYINIVLSENGISKIIIDGKYYYIESDDATLNSPQRIRITAIMGLLFVSLFVSVAYLAVSWFRKRKLS